MSDRGWTRAALGDTFKRITRFLKIPSNAGALTPHWLIGPDVPLAISNYYASNPTPISVTAVMQGFDNAGNYSYIAWLYSIAANHKLLAFGYVYNGAVYEMATYDFEAGLTRPRSIIFGDDIGSRADGMIWDFNGVTGAIIDSTNQTTYSAVNVGNSVDLTMDGVSAGRGVILFVPLAAPFNVTTVGAAIFGDLNSATFRAKRAYRVSWGGTFSASLTTNQLGLSVRINGVVQHHGGAYGPIGGGTFNPGCYGHTIIKNSGLVDLVRTVDINALMDAGTGIIQQGALDQFQMVVEDIGASSKYPNAWLIP